MAGAGLWLAMLSFDSKISNPQIDFNDGIIAVWSSPSRERLGLSEARRKEIFKRQGQMLLNATDAASARYPKDIKAQLRVEKEMKEEDRKALLSELGLTDQQLDDIESEGVSSGWVPDETPRNLDNLTGESCPD